MTATPLDRDTAHRINPIISCLGTEDTLEGVSRIISDIGYIATAAANAPDTIPLSRMFMVMSSVAAALDYEVTTLQTT